MGWGSWPKVFSSVLVALTAFSVVSCRSGGKAALDGVVVFDNDVQLERSGRQDQSRLEFKTDGAATFVAWVDETDADIKVRLESGAAQSANSSVEVESDLYGSGVEVATLDVPAGSRAVLRLIGSVEAEKPGHGHVRVMRFATPALDSRVAARIAAFRAWTAATRSTITPAETRTSGFRQIDSALAHFQSADGDPHLAAWARLIRANMSLFHSIDWQAALADTRLAEQAFLKLSDAHDAARARFFGARALVEIAQDETAKNPTAEEADRVARSALAELSDSPALSPLERARCVNELGVIAFNAYKWGEATVKFRQALATFRALGRTEGELMVLTNLGVLTDEEGDFVAATRIYDEVLPKIDAMALVERRILILIDAARADANAGLTDRAIERLLVALQWSREEKSPVNEARALHSLGLAYWARGDAGQAATFFNEGLKIRRTLPDGAGLIASLRNAGTFARESGDVAKALALHRESEALARGSDYRLWILFDIALDYVAKSDYERAIAVCREALALKLSAPDWYMRHEFELMFANLLLERPGRNDASLKEALPLIERALATAVRRSDISMEITARRLLAQSLVARGKFAAARPEFERAIALIFQYRSTTNNPELQSATLAQEQAAFRGYIDLLMRDVVAHGAGRFLPATGDAEYALRTIERARAMNFDAVRAAELPVQSQARIDALLVQMAGKRVRLATVVNRASAPPELDALQLDMAKLRAQIDQVRAGATGGRNSSGALPELNQPWPPLRAGVTQLSYALGEHYTYLWIRDATGIRAALLAETPAAIERLLTALAATRPLPPENLEQALAGLSRVLLPDGVFTDDTRALEIVSDGSLAPVPFAALQSPANRSHRLVETHSIVAISTWFEPGSRPAARPHHAYQLIAVTAGGGGARAAPSQGLPALATASAEGRAVASLFGQIYPPAGIKLLSGADGNAAELRKIWSGGVDVIHFATHGLADLRQPMASLLMLPAPDAAGDPTYLTAGQVQEWRGDADLVYLSACETALGPTRFADGMPGLQRAFLRAGARGVIATLWPIEDVYASQFAADFYRRYTQGMPAAQALSETQRAWAQPVPGLSSKEQAHRRMTAWAHVYYAQ